MLRSPPNRGGWERRKKGAVLLGVLAFLPIILLGLALYTQRILTEQDQVRRTGDDIRALYLANAALAKATYEVVKDRDYRGSASAVDLTTADGKDRWDYLVEGSEVHPELDFRVKISARGAFLDPSDRADVTRALEVIAKPALGRSVLDYAVAAGNMLKLNAGSQIGDPGDKDNHVYLGANLITPSETLYGPGATFLYGKAELLTSVPQADPPTMDPGPIEYGVEELFFPSYDLAALKAKAQANTSNPAYPGGMYFVGETTLKDETVNGVVYVENGTLYLKGNVTINGTLVCDGPFGIRSTANVTIDSSSVDFTNEAPNVAIVQVGAPKMVFSPSTDVDITGFIFCDTVVQIDADGTITGSIIAEQHCEIGGQATVYFKKIDAIEMAREILVPGRWELDVEAWVEDPAILPEVPDPSGGSGVPTDPPPDPLAV